MGKLWALRYGHLSHGGLQDIHIGRLERDRPIDGRWWVQRMTPDGKPINLGQGPWHDATLLAKGPKDEIMAKYQRIMSIYDEHRKATADVTGKVKDICLGGIARP